MLAEPARYFPIANGLYEVAPGLRTLGTDFGNGDLDRKLFQIDRDFARYRENKLACRRERLPKYFQTADFRCEREVSRFIVERLVIEYPTLFALREKGEERQLACVLTGETVVFDADYGFRRTEQSQASPAYVSGFDALISQVPEDIAVIQRELHRDWLAALHLSSPSHWAAEEKIGKNFFAIHAPVPGIEKLNRAASSFVDAMITKGPYVRFVWGFGSDERLNHHPEPAPNWDATTWKGRSFDRTRPGAPFFLRVERQVTWGLPAIDAALFAIRVSFVNGEAIRADAAMRAQLRSALLSMSPESRVYKGVDESMSRILEWLDEPSTSTLK